MCQTILGPCTESCCSTINIINSTNSISFAAQALAGSNRIDSDGQAQ